MTPAVSATRSTAPEVARIGDPVEGHEERVGLPEQVVELGRHDGIGAGHHPLRRLGSRPGRQLLGGDLADPDAGLGGQVEDLVDRGRLPCRARPRARGPAGAGRAGSSRTALRPST